MKEEQEVNNCISPGAWHCIEPPGPHCASRAGNDLSCRRRLPRCFAIICVLEAAALLKLEHVQGDYARVCHNGLRVGGVLQGEQKGQCGTSECLVSDTRLPGCWKVLGPCTITT